MKRFLLSATVASIIMGGAGLVMAFDILSDGLGGNAGWLLAGGTLHQVDLATGKATAAGKIDGVSGTITDIAAWAGM
jgi:hypothetical protein